jgi:thermitase
MQVHKTGPRLLYVALAVLLVLATSASGGASAAPASGRVRSGQVLVELRPGVSAERVAGRVGASVEPEHAGRARRLKVPPGQERARAQELLRDPDVVAAAPNFVRGAQDTTPNDVGYPQQWHLPQVGAPAGWSTSTGSRSIKVAVLDSGVDLTHPDLIPNLLPGVNLLCSDPGWTPPTPAYCATATPQDDFGHGTHVAGILGAAGNNTIGVAGVSWQVGIMPVKVLDAGGSGTDAQIINGIDWAIANGAQVINLSVGGAGDSQVLDNAVRRAWDAGLVVVVAAGNSATSEPFYPAASPGALAVSATNAADQPSRYSNYGSQVGIAAPGDNIYSTLPGGSYGYLTGTSMSTPIVAGAAALALAVRPGLSNGQVVGALLAPADKVGGYAYNADGWNNCFGYGRLDLAGTVTAASGNLAPSTVPPTLRPQAPSSSVRCGFRITLPVVPRQVGLTG